MATHKCYLICWIIALLFIFISRTDAAALNFDYEESMICIPNATFHIDCNRCRCSPSGMSMDCTDWMCATLQIHYDLLMNLSIDCQPNEIFIYKNLKCLCLESAQNALCSSAQNELAHELQPATNSNAQQVISLEQPRQRRRQRRRCPAGLVFKSQSGDTCICHEKNHHHHQQQQLDSACLGVVHVERAATSAEPLSPSIDLYYTSGDEKQKVCVPSSSFSLDCNQCVCSNDGFSFSCDSFPCLGVEMRDDQLLNLTLACTPSSLFLYNRHECLCSADGSNAICSLVGEIMHTYMGQVIVTESRGACTPGAVFKDVCNICICGPDGKAACTMMDCELGWEKKRDEDGRIVRKGDIWVQRMRNKRFCRKNEGTGYCRYMRKY